MEYWDYHKTNWSFGSKLPKGIKMAIDEALKELKHAAHVLPPARLINESIFELDRFSENSTPAYNVQVAFDPDTITGGDTFEDVLIDFAAAAFGVSEADYLAGKVFTPFRNGDEMAATRQENGKAGDAYLGKLVVSTRTQIDRYGVKGGAAGVQVYGADTKKVESVPARELIYQGCMVILIVTLNDYRVSVTNQPAISLRLSAVQFAGTGERLGAGERDYSSVLKPVSAPSARRERR